MCAPACRRRCLRDRDPAPRPDSERSTPLRRREERDNRGDDRCSGKRCRGTRRRGEPCSGTAVVCCRTATGSRSTTGGDETRQPTVDDPGGDVGRKRRDLHLAEPRWWCRSCGRNPIGCRIRWHCRSKHRSSAHPRPLRPILAVAAQGAEGGLTVPGVLARLVGMWLVGSALPCAAIAVLVFIRSNGWIIQKTASVEIPVLVITLAAVLVGLPAMILTSRSISDPIREVVDAMAQVEHGRINSFVGVYERSEIGCLQSGFNRMVAAIAERDRLHDLFGRHVGPDVARRALEEGASLSGDVREVAVLFIDLVGSTRLAASRPPQEVAEVLNDFFRIVVGAVDDQHGLINKFQGDAALAVFGAPLPTRGAASAALVTARTLRSHLRRLPVVDFGIGVSAGPVFAGNVGAENRYEYTVIGDAVNEAARLADLAKTLDRRVVCSAAAIDRRRCGRAPVLGFTW